ncbi:MAG: lipopolysaccharide biosynthesis protein [Terracidiphilus sp.]
MRLPVARSLKPWFARSGFVRGVTLLVGGTAISQALAILASPILTRIYTPSDFGVLQVFIALMYVVLVPAAGRYEVAILLPEDEQSAIDLLALAALCVCATTIITAVLVLICQYHWILPLSVLVLQRYLWLLPISVFGAGIYQVLNYWALRRENYRQIAVSKFTQVGSQLVAQIGIGLLEHGPFGLLLGDALGRMSGSTRFIRDLWRDYASLLRKIKFSRIMKLAVRYREYPLVSMWGGLVNASGLALPALFLAQYYGAKYTGWFALVTRVLGIPAGLIGLNISQIYASEAGRLSRTDPKRLMHIFLKTTRHMLYLGIVPCIIFMIFAPWLFQLVFGNVWREAGEYARYLALMFFVGFVNAPVMWTLTILERQRAQMAWDISSLVVTVLAMVLPHLFGYGPRVAIIFYSIAMTLMFGIHWIMSYFGIGRRVNQTITLANSTYA